MLDKIKDYEIVNLLQSMIQQFKNMDNTWLNFYVSIYNFKELETGFGYSEIALSDGTVVKKTKIVKELFNISPSTYSKIATLVDRFIILDNNDNSIICVRGDVRDFDKSKLMELLYLDEEQLQEALKNQDISPTSSVSEIRKYIRSLKKEEKCVPTKEEMQLIQEDLKKVTSLNIHTHITDTDLKKLSKGEIILKYLELQLAYENLKELRKRS